jgi:uncharacterized membrane protein YfcA
MHFLTLLFCVLFIACAEIIMSTVLQPFAFSTERIFLTGLAGLFGAYLGEQLRHQLPKRKRKKA